MPRRRGRVARGSHVLQRREHDRNIDVAREHQAFYFYVESNYYSTSFTYTAITDSGATSTPIVVAGSGGGHGFAFHSTAGENIASITINGTIRWRNRFRIGQFGINAGPSNTCASEGYTGTKLTWCKNICEMGYTGATLDMWIHRWINRYRDLPYCAASRLRGLIPEAVHTRPAQAGLVVRGRKGRVPKDPCDALVGFRGAIATA